MHAKHTVPQTIFAEAQGSTTALHDNRDDKRVKGWQIARRAALTGRRESAAMVLFGRE